MTQDRMQLSELLEKAGADEFVRDMIGFVAQRLMDLDVDNRCGASHGERTDARTNSRNGFRDRQWDTRAGSVGTAYPEAACGQLLSALPGTPAHRREGTGRRHPGSLRAGHLDPLGR